jgi:hypothetical protein
VGYALRESLAAAAGVPVVDVILLGAHCTGGAVTYVAFQPTDPVNTYFPPPGSARLLVEYDSGSGDRELMHARSLQGSGGGSSTLIDIQLSSIPSDPAALGSSSTGLAAVPSLTGASNVAARIAAMAGAVPTSVAAINVSLTVNSTSLAASLSSIISAWAAATNQSSADVSFGIQSVAAGTTPPSSSHPAQPLSLIVTLPVVLGVLLAAAAVALWRRTRAAPPKPQVSVVDAPSLPRLPSQYTKAAADVVVVPNDAQLVLSEAAVVVAVEDPSSA